MERYTAGNPVRSGQAGSSVTSEDSLRTNNGTMWTLEICPTTGGQHEIKVKPEDTIEDLKRHVVRKVKIPKERICLLCKDRVLREGTLRDNGVQDGSKITLLPSVESGLLSHKPEPSSVMQALENLNEEQVSEFLAGKSPLTLAMRLGDHMMFVQLQLSMSTPGSKRLSSSGSSRSSKRTVHSTTAPQFTTSPVPSRTPCSSAGPSSTRSTRPTAVYRNSDHSSSSSSRVANNVKTGSTSVKNYRPNNVSVPSRSKSASSTSTASLMSSSTSSASASASQPIPTSSSSSTDLGRRAAVVDRYVPVVNSSSLVEASRNLSERLRELSHHTARTCHKEKEQVETVTVPVAGAGPCSGACGATIESMNHHGQGIYSGTFSGTLNPALQDQSGKPRQSVDTIIHILNDLLSAQPHYRRSHLHSRHPHMERAPGHRHHRPRVFHSHRPVHRPVHQPAVKPQDMGLQERLSAENLTTKGKMEALQMKLEQRRQHKKARREARASPYATAAWGGNVKSRNSSSSSEAQAMEVDANVETSNVTDSVTERDNTAYTELTQETIVA